MTRQPGVQVATPVCQLAMQCQCRGTADLCSENPSCVGSKVGWVVVQDESFSARGNVVGLSFDHLVNGIISADSRKWTTTMISRWHLL